MFYECHFNDSSNFEKQFYIGRWVDKYRNFPVPWSANFGLEKLFTRRKDDDHGARMIIETWFIDPLQLEKFLLKLPRIKAIIALIARILPK